MRPRKYPYSKKQVQYRTVKRSLGLGKGIMIERVFEDSFPISQGWKIERDVLDEHVQNC